MYKYLVISIKASDFCYPILLIKQQNNAMKGHTLITASIKYTIITIHHRRTPFPISIIPPEFIPYVGCLVSSRWYLVKVRKTCSRLVWLSEYVSMAKALFPVSIMSNMEDHLVSVIGM